ncbi:MAG: hypothetical protein KI790_19435 [Cyclobacteriaceae bacterium]|nr:hypothetical protein [Cyclobacteriaceae bacterium HetDA_MAG_MS6]
MTIEVFRTDVTSEKQASEVRDVLSKKLGYEHIAFDLEDCDRILRIEAESISNQSVISHLARLGIVCKVLPE